MASNVFLKTQFHCGSTSRPLAATSIVENIARGEGGTGRGGGWAGSGHLAPEPRLIWRYREDDLQCWSCLNGERLLFVQLEQVSFRGSELHPAPAS